MYLYNSYHSDILWTLPLIVKPCLDIILLHPQQKSVQIDFGVEFQTSLYCFLREQALKISEHQHTCWYTELVTVIHWRSIPPSAVHELKFLFVSRYKFYRESHSMVNVLILWRCDYGHDLSLTVYFLREDIRMSWINVGIDWTDSFITTTGQSGTCITGHYIKSEA